MSEIAEKLKLEASRLSVQERAEIAHFLINSLDEEIDEDVEAEWDAELKKRLEDIHTGKAVYEPFDKVISELREKYS